MYGYLKNKKEELLLQKNFNVIDEIWNYFIINGIDINSTKTINKII